jgi:hypothetical protein
VSQNRLEDFHITADDFSDAIESVQKNAGDQASLELGKAFDRTGLPSRFAAFLQTADGAAAPGVAPETYMWKGEPVEVLESTGNLWRVCPLGDPDAAFSISRDKLKSTKSVVVPEISGDMAQFASALQGQGYRLVLKYKGSQYLEQAEQEYANWTGGEQLPDSCVKQYGNMFGREWTLVFVYQEGMPVPFPIEPMGTHGGRPSAEPIGLSKGHVVTVNYPQIIGELVKSGLRINCSELVQEVRASEKNPLPKKASLKAAAVHPYQEDAEIVVAQVLNGGFMQLWDNYSGRNREEYNVPSMIHRTAKFFKDKGREDIAKIFSQAARVDVSDIQDQRSGNWGNMSEEAYNQAYDAIQEQFAPFEDEFYKLWESNYENDPNKRRDWETYFENEPKDSPVFRMMQQTKASHAVGKRTSKAALTPPVDPEMQNAVQQGKEEYDRRHGRTPSTKITKPMPEKGTPEYAQLKIAIQNLKMPAPMLGVMGGPSVEESKQILAQYGLKWDEAKGRPVTDWVPRSIPGSDYIPKKRDPRFGSSSKTAAWVGFSPDYPVQVVGVKNGQITPDGWGVQSFPNFAAAKEAFPALDPYKSSAQFTWAMADRNADNSFLTRFETWPAYKMYST